MGKSNELEVVIPKPFLVDLKCVADDRGYLIPLTNDIPYDIKKEIKRTYIVGNFGEGVIRGFHAHEKEIKIFYIVKGSAKFIAIDPSAPENKYVFSLCERSNKLLVIPAKLANGWMSLQDGTILVALSTSTFEESAKDDKRYDPFEWGTEIWDIKAR